MEQAEFWNDAKRDGLAGALREFVEQQRVWKTEARGRSMSPTIPDGTLVEISPLPERLVVDELIAFVPPNAAAMVVHRVLDVRDDGSVLTRGDSRACDDGWIARERQIGVVRRYWLGGRCFQAAPGAPYPRPSRMRRRLQWTARVLRRLGLLRF